MSQLEDSLGKEDKKGRRNYKIFGGPLAFFLAHPKNYSGLSRTQLFLKDEPMYIALRKSGELEKAIPNVIPRSERDTGRKNLSRKEIDVINLVFSHCNQSLTETSRILKWHYLTIRKYLKQEGLLPDKSVGRPPLSEKEVDKIVANYNFYGKVNSTAAATGYSERTVSKYLKLRGVI